MNAKWITAIIVSDEGRETLAKAGVFLPQSALFFYSEIVRDSIVHRLDDLEISYRVIYPHKPVLGGSEVYKNLYQALDVAISKTQTI